MELIHAYCFLGGMFVGALLASWGKMPNRWWCRACKQYLHPHEVTFQETHDVRCGGCGGNVS